MEFHSQVLPFNQKMDTSGFLFSRWSCDRIFRKYTYVYYVHYTYHIQTWEPKTASTDFSGDYGDAFCMGPCSLWFVKSIWFRYGFCWTKCWEIVALLWLWRQDRGHTWPYMARHDQFLLIILKLKFLLFSSMTFFGMTRYSATMTTRKGFAVSRYKYTCFCICNCILHIFVVTNRWPKKCRVVRLEY